MANKKQSRIVEQGDTFEVVRPGLNPHTIYEVIQEATYLPEFLFNSTNEDFSSEEGILDEGTWRPPTEAMISNFKKVRQVYFEKEVRDFNYKKPELKNELIRLKDKLSILWWDISNVHLELERMEEAYENLAILVGIVDFLKSLYRENVPEGKQEPNDVILWVRKIIDPTKDKKKISKLDFTIRQVALYKIYCWTGKPDMSINSGSAKAIIRDNEFSIKDEKDLIRKYNAFSTSKKRTKDLSPIKANWLRKDIATILPFLKTKEAITQASMELKSLSDLIKNSDYK
jgi:hypothetical protein